MLLASSKKISLFATALTIVTLATSCSTPQKSIESSSEGNSFAPKTVAALEGSQAINEADTARLSLKVKVNTANAIGVANGGPAKADGRVYNVLTAVNIRSCPSTSCRVLRVARPGADLQNDRSAGIRKSNGYTWVKVTYGYASTNSCSTQQHQGWMIINPLAPGSVHISKGPLNVRSSPCNGKILLTYNKNTNLNFHSNSNQYSGKWYRVNASATKVGWIDGWDFADVY